MLVQRLESSSHLKSRAYRELQTIKAKITVMFPMIFNSAADFQPSNLRFAAIYTFFSLTISMDKEVSLGDLLSKYKTVRHFCTAYRQSGKLVIDDDYVSWSYIRRLVVGEKLLIILRRLEISACLSSRFKRLKELNVGSLWTSLKQDREFFKYFPDIFLKRNPPRNYLWQVLAVVKPDLWKSKVDVELAKLRKSSKIKPDMFRLTEEASQIFEKFNHDRNIDLLSWLTSLAKE